MDEVQEVLRQALQDVANARERIDYLTTLDYGLSAEKQQALHDSLCMLAARLSKVRITMRVILESGQD